MNCPPAPRHTNGSFFHWIVNPLKTSEDRGINVISLIFLIPNKRSIRITIWERVFLWLVSKNSAIGGQTTKLIIVCKDRLVFVQLLTH